MLERLDADSGRNGGDSSADHNRASSESVVHTPGGGLDLGGGCSPSRRTLGPMCDPEARLDVAWDAARRQERAEQDEHIAEDAALAERLVDALRSDDDEHDQDDPK